MPDPWHRKVQVTSPDGDDATVQVFVAGRQVIMVSPPGGCVLGPGANRRLRYVLELAEQASDTSDGRPSC